MRLRKQLLTRNDCYKAGRTIKVKGVMVHSTGADNPRVSRYVPGNDEMGRNKAGNHWDQPDLKKCVHAFVGQFTDGGVGAVQTLPWNWRGWHCGKGKKGSANDTHISFEICEDGLTDPVYFQAIYREAVELTAYLCREYELDPMKDGVVICHLEGYERGVASNHGDVLHWFPRHGKDMDDFRADVARAMDGAAEQTMMEQTMEGEDDEMLTYEQWKEYMTRYRQELGELPAPDWSAGELARAVELGITDGTRPQDLVTRTEAAVMAARSLEKE